MEQDLKVDNGQVWKEFEVEGVEEIDNWLSKQENADLIQLVNNDKQIEVTRKIEKDMFKYRNRVFPEYVEKSKDRATTAMLVVLQECRDRLSNTKI